ncbi:MAG: acyl carrier protein [Candidatus Firestonebacteria bacterium]|nr:acyl carrier protein [Candidatus Firestonebacteria bacterium]
MLDPLEQELKEMLVEVCRIVEPLPADLSADAPLIGPDSPFHLDSLDAVEIVVAVQRKYNVRIENQESSRQVFRSLKTLADHIRRHRPQ